MIFIKKFDHFSAMLFNNCARQWNNCKPNEAFLKAAFPCPGSLHFTEEYKFTQYDMHCALLNSSVQALMDCHRELVYTNLQVLILLVFFLVHDEQKSILVLFPSNLERSQLVIDM